MERTWRWFASGFAIVICVVAGILASRGDWLLEKGSFVLFGFAYVCPALFYLAFAFGYLLVRQGSVVSARWLNLLLFISLVQSLALWLSYWESGTLPRAAFWVFLVAALVVGFRGLAVSGGVSSPLGWLRGLRAVPGVLLGVGAALVVSSLFLQVTLTPNGSGGHPVPTGWRLLLRQARWVTAEIGLTRDVDDLATGIPSVAFDMAGYFLYGLAILAALITLGSVIRSRFVPARLRSSVLLPFVAAATMLSALWAVSDIYWGWQFPLDSVGWAAWLGFACWAATLAFGLAAVLQIARARGGRNNLCDLMLFQVPLALFNFFMVPEYIHDSMGHGFFTILPLAGLGLLLMGLQMQSWAYAALLLDREMTLGAERTFAALEDKPATTPPTRPMRAAK